MRLIRTVILHVLVGMSAAAQAAAAQVAAMQAATPAYHAGETSRVTTVETGAIRNHGDSRLQLLVWYPVSASLKETRVVLGNEKDPFFVAGAAAHDAPWVDGPKRPLVLLSHGFGGLGRQLTWLGTALARAGYIAVAVDHPGTNGRDGVTPEGVNLFFERATDIRTALDYVLADATIAARVDPKRIGAAGFSLGGYTTALLAGAQSDGGALERFCRSAQRDAICDPQLEYTGDVSGKAPILAEPRMQPYLAREKLAKRDPRIRAAFLIAPAIVQGMDLGSLAKISIPVTVLVGTEDPIVPPKTNAYVLAARIPGAKLITLPHVGHYDFLSECGSMGLREAADYCADGAGTRRAATHATAVDAALRFFEANLR